MKKILSVALSTAMAFSMFASVAFGETATTPQAKFDALAAKGILNGYPDGQAHLEKDLTRAEFAKIVTKLFGLTEVTGKLSYKDKGYTATNWAVPYIEAVTAANLMQGKDTVKGIFDYNGKVTVEEVAAVLFRALKLETPATTDNSASAWAKGYAQAVINAGLVAQGTNFKANATRSLVVEAAYAVDNLTAVPTVASAEALSPTSVYVTFSDKTTTTVTLTTALVEGVETTINFKNNGHDYTAKVTLAAPKVVSVTAPNAKQLVVKFNRAVDSASVIESSNKTLVDGVIVVSTLGTAEPVTINTANAVLSGDKTELVLTLPGSEVGQKLEFLKGQYTVTVTGSVKTEAGSTLAPYTTLLTVADTTAPSIVSVTAAARTSINKVTVKLSEPVYKDRIIATVDGGSANIAYGSNLSELILTTTKNLESGKSYNLTLLNLTDYAQNTVSPNPATATVTVSSDVVAPTIASVKVVGERQVEVTFSKGIDKNSLNGAVRVLNGNGELLANMNVEPTSETAPTTLTLTLPDTEKTKIPNTGTLNATLVFPTTIKDILGNTLTAASTHSVSFVKDTVAPTVSSVTYTSTGIAIKFSEKIVYVGGTGSASLINEATGSSTPISDAVLNNRVLSSGDTVISLPVTGLSGNYTLRLNSGFVKDTAGTPNNSAAAVASFSATATASTDTTKPAISNLVKGTVPTGAPDQFVKYDVVDAGGLNIATVRDINNYTLDGKALPAGSYVTTTATTAAPTGTVTVSVYIPSSAIGSTAAQRFVINGIKDTAGNTAIAEYANFSFPDSVKPTLVSGAISSDASTRAILTFSEDIVEGTISDTDFTVKVNGITANKFSVTKFTDSKYYLTVEAKSDDNYNGYKVLYFDANNNNKADDGEVVAYTTDAAGNINFNSSAISSVTVEVKDTSDIKDKAIPANNIVTGTVITVK